MRLVPASVLICTLLSVSLAHAGAPPSAPQPLWSAHYNGPFDVDAGTSVTLDAAGNVYVVGYSTSADTEADFVTVKYDPSGRALWTVRYDGPAHGTEIPTAVSVDAAGNVYVAGRSARDLGSHDYALVKYSPSGRLIWVQRQPFNPTVVDGDYAKVYLAVNPAGEAWVACDGPNVYLTAKYRPNGRLSWTRIFRTTPTAFGSVRGIDVDGGGNAFVTGSFSDFDAGDIITVKYSPNGDESRVFRTDSGTRDANIAADVEVDGSGSVYVTGTLLKDRATFDTDFITAKYAADGTELWVREIDRGANSVETAVALAVDGSGNVIVTGWAGVSTPAQTSDYLTVKYDRFGELQWVRGFSGAFEDRAVGLGIDARGNSYVTGSIGQPSFAGYTTLKYTPTGDLAWAEYYHGPAPFLGEARAIAVDETGKVAVTGLIALSGSLATAVDYGFGTVVYSGTETRPVLSEFSVSTPTVASRKSLRGLLRISGPAAATGSISLTSSHPDVLPVPPQGVRLPRGRSSVVLKLRARSVATPTLVTLTAHYGGVSREVVVTVRPR
jgi:hypothetical protein